MEKARPVERWLKMDRRDKKKVEAKTGREAYFSLLNLSLANKEFLQPGTDIMQAPFVKVGLDSPRSPEL